MSHPNEDGRSQTGSDRSAGQSSIVDIYGPDIGPLLTGGLKIIKYESPDTGIPVKRLEAATLDDHGTISIPDEFGGDTKIAAVLIFQDKNATLAPMTRTVGIPEIATVRLPEDNSAHIGFFIGYNPVREEPSGIIRTSTLRVMRGLRSFPLTFELTRQGVTRSMVEIPYRLIGDNMKEEETAIADQTGIFDRVGFPRARTRGVLGVTALHNKNMLTSRIHQRPDSRFQIVSLLTKVEPQKPPVNLSLQAGIFVSMR